MRWYVVNNPQPGVLLMTLVKMWGGGPLPKEVGDSLTRDGISIFPQYGW